MYNNEIWTKHTRLILTGVIIVAIAGWVAGIRLSRFLVGIAI